MQDKATPGPTQLVRAAIAEITELIPAESLYAALTFAATELHAEAARRDVQMLAMYATGRTEVEIAAYREATADIRDLAARWDFELATGGFA